MINNILDEIDAVIFDMDGSLVDSMWIWKQIDIDHFAMNGKELPEDFQSQVDGMSLYQTAVYVKETFAFDETVEEMVELWNSMAYKKYAEDVCYKKGVEDFLCKCLERDIKLGIATSNSRHLYDAVAKHLDFNQYFECVITGTEVTNGKPAPDVYLKAAEEMGVDPKRCLVFEDIVKGIQAGHNAGMKVCAVDDSYSFEQRSEKQKAADYFIYDFTEIVF